ncbi:MAG: hypothetical protein NTU61_01045, partial [Candidatus Altiarchaeota archaeon]|nr:hypothetical protein [Candidatus Altiarchaeota archaeon]
ERDYLTGVEGVYLVGEGRKLSHDEARKLAEEYCQFVLNRYNTKIAFGFSTARLDVIHTKEEMKGVGEIDVVFFNRSYVGGVAVDKIDDRIMTRQGVAPTVAYLMGVEAAANFALGRANPSTGKVMYGDGDEIIQFDRNLNDPAAMPNDLIVADFSSILGDVTSTYKKFTPEYAKWLSGLVKRCAQHGADADELRLITVSYLRGLRAEYDRISRPETLESLREDLAESFAVGGDTIGRQRYGWVGCDYLVPKTLQRMGNTTSRQLVESILADESLKEFRNALPKAEQIFK